MPVVFTDRDKAAMIAEPGNIAALYRALSRQLGMLERADVEPYLRRMGLFGANGRAGIQNITRHFHRLEKGAAFLSDMLGRPASVRAVDFGPVQVRYADDDLASRTFFEVLLEDGEIHEPGVTKLLLANLRTDDIFFDVGAHTGYLSCLAGARGAIVFALELQQSIVPIIKRNALLNGLQRVHVINAAAGARDGMTAVMRYHPTLSGRALGEGGDRAAVSIDAPALDWLPVLRLDTLAGSLPRPPKLVKIDGEGSELQILAGARRLIAARRTLFMVEFHVSLVGEFGGTRDDLYPFFPPEHWTAALIEDAGLRPLDGDALHALLDPETQAGRNPSLLFTPRPQEPR